LEDEIKNKREYLIVNGDENNCLEVSEKFEKWINKESYE
jgi:hypothetical protein